MVSRDCRWLVGGLQDDLDDLLIARLCAEIELPEPDPATWRQQIRDVYAQIRDQYLRYPGLLAGGVEPQTAAWALSSRPLNIAR